MLAEPCRELFHVVGGRRPGLLLCRAVVVLGQFLDAGAENLSQKWSILRQERPQARLRIGARAHRAASQVVPSLESLSTTPMAASSSRMRSDSLKFLALRAALRAAIRLS